MLGKRCRTLQRTASISQNMGPHFLHHNNHHNYPDQAANYPKGNAENILSLPFQPTNPHTQAIIPQIIGFNPISKHDQTSPQSKACRLPDHPGVGQKASTRPPPHDLFDDDPVYNLQQKLAGDSVTTTTTTAPGAPSKRSQITPRSALQTLLAAARQITCNTDHQSPGALISKNHESSSCKSAALIKPSPASPSCAAASSSVSYKQGSLMWPGFTLGESKPKEISTNQSAIKSVVIKAEAKAVPECFSVSICEAESDSTIFHVEGTTNLATDDHFGLESGQTERALYLATSPLAADLIPNLAASMSFMESCYLCKRRLGLGRDIFMYRGESAFCSTECRDNQMRLEERKEKLRCMPLKMNDDMQKQEFYNTINILSSNGAPHYQHNKPNHHHHHEYNSQAHDNKQHCISLIMPTA